MMRRLMPAYLVGVACYVAFSLTQDLGPGIEARFLPVRVDQAVERIERSGARMCWDWSGRKVRPLASDNLDVFVRVNGGEAFVASVFRADSGQPWRASASPAVGPVRTRYCLTLPLGVVPVDDVRVSWIAYYPSPMRIYRLAIPLPEIVSPGTKP
ncbi:hypothetical protein MKK55_18630 [Methylobacterium sp. J-059]|uniref:hypothetical protein n=1 Tax=Methylobacterium sp. J-059 TaxID=2836643 RepID=UPI001FBB17D6|nr:hypothetical protein [Methylobacterium sp. J-059]MCJ2040947.1 hypothetical protein [Methylobacterium sp. J-059]